MEDRDENTYRLSAALEDQIEYFRKEYKVTYASVIGVLEMIKLKMWSEAAGLDRD